MAKAIRICLNASCGSYGAGHVMRDIEELVNGQCPVEEWGCLGRCGLGPNAEVVTGRGTNIVEDLTSFKRLNAFLKEDCELEVAKTIKELGKLKYKIRREEDPAKRQEQFQKAFDSIGGENSTSQAVQVEPMLLSSLLVLRAKDTLKSKPQEALKDAQRASTMTPKWAQPFIVLAQALEALGRSTEGVAALKTALEIGKGINVGGTKRQLQRLERKAKDEPAQAAAPAAAADAAAPAAAKAKTKAKSSSSGKKEEKQEKKEEKVAAPPLPPPPIEEELPEFLEWGLEQVTTLNHDCIRMEFTAEQPHFLARQANAGQIWHIELLKEDEASGDELKRSYTPVSKMDAYLEGRLELMVKIYPRGKMTSYLAKLRPGAKVLVSAPSSTLQASDYRGLVMIAGGSAVTVAIQVCREVLEHYKGAVPVHLVLCNKTMPDVLYVDVFDKMVADYSTLHVTHCVSAGNVPASGGRHKWHGGRISASVFAGMEPGLKCIVSGPMGLCQAATVLWKQLGRDAASLKILDELPPPGSKLAEEAAAKVAPPPPKEPEPVAIAKPAELPNQETMAVKLAKPKVEPEGLSFMQRLLMPFTICRGKGLEEDDADGTSPIMPVN